VTNAPGYVDYRNGEFVAGFDYDATAIVEIKALHGRRWEPKTREWIVARSHRSAAGLLAMARKRGWVVSPEARNVAERLQELADEAELSVDVVHGSAGEPWFLCMFGDDAGLQQRVRTIPGAYVEVPEDSWWVPAFRADSAELLLDIVGSDERLIVSDAAWRLLAEPDIAYFSPESTIPEQSRRGSTSE